MQNAHLIGRTVPMSEVTKVSVQGAAALGSHFATLFQEVDFYEAKKSFHY